MRNSAFIAVVSVFWMYLCAGVAADARMPEYRPGEVLVQFKSQARAVARQRLDERFGARARRSFGRGRILQMALPPDLSVREAVTLFREDPDVEFVEPNYLLRAQAAPNDPGFAWQWGLHNIGQVVNGYAGKPGADIDAVRAWELASGDEETVVAVIDTGCNLAHPDLAGNLWRNTGEIEGNGIDDDQNGYVDDVHGWDFYDHDNSPQDASGHGTHVAGIISALGDNGIGAAGIGWRVRIMPLRFMNAFDLGAVSDAIDAIEYAVAQGARIINCSWGTTSYSFSLYTAMAAADALFVCAAGNNGTDNDSTGFYPAGYLLDNIVSTAASDQMDQLAWFSNYGRQRVHVAAPGIRIYSLGLGRRLIWSQRFDGGMDGWTTGGGPDTWLVRAAPAGAAVLAVTPQEAYADNTDSWAISPPLSLHETTACRMSFQLIGASEAGRDFLYVEASNDGVVWVNQPVKVGGAIQYNGISGSIPYWVAAAVDLGAWDESPQFFVRFRFKSDAGHSGTGFFLDHITLSAASDQEEYAYLSGTSMAAGFVSGVAALVQSRHGALSVATIKTILTGSVDLGQDLADVSLSGGRINAFNALMLLSDLSLSADSTGADSIQLTWTGGVSPESQVVVERRAEGQIDFVPIANADSMGAGFTDSQLDAGTTYYYRVQAETQDGRNGYSNQTLATTGDRMTTSVDGGGGGGGGCFIRELMVDRHRE